MVVAGTILAGMLAKKTRNEAFIVCVPPAFAVFGGTFIHITQIAAALPAAVLLAAYAPRAYRNLAVVVLLLLAVPWVWAYSPTMILAPLVPVAYLAWRYWSGNVVAVLLAGIAAAVMIFGLSSAGVGGPARDDACGPRDRLEPRRSVVERFTQKSSTQCLRYLDAAPADVGRSRVAAVASGP